MRSRYALRSFYNKYYAIQTLAHKSSSDVIYLPPCNIVIMILYVKLVSRLRVKTILYRSYTKNTIFEWRPQNGKLFGKPYILLY